MREIKFQVINENEIFGLERLVDGHWESMCYYLNPDKGERWIDRAFTGDFIRRQFTGLKDKNGVEIYEGDILKKLFGSSIPTFEVAWHNERSMFIQNDGYNEPLNHIDTKTCEVIGNIYENHER